MSVTTLSGRTLNSKHVINMIDDIISHIVTDVDQTRHFSCLMRRGLCGKARDKFY